jgi:hypothetical protein
MRATTKLAVVLGCAFTLAPASSGPKPSGAAPSAPTLAAGLVSAPVVHASGQPRVEERTMNSKATLLDVLPDGRRRYAFDSYVGPIHYKHDLDDPDEPWKDIDTTIRTSDRPDYQFQNKENFFESYFRERARAKDLVKYQSGDSFITYTLQDNELGPLRDSVGHAEDNVFIYPDAYPGADVRFSVSSERLLEEFVLHAYRPVERLSQRIRFEGAYFEPRRDGSYQFYDSTTHEKIWTIARPVMYELGDRETKSYGLHFELSCTEGSTCVLVKVLDDEGKAWLADEARKFPLVIDATVDRDAAAGSDDYGKFYGLSDARIMFGGVSGYSADYGQGFRFTNITIPQGSTVTSAHLSIVCTNNNWIGTDVRLTAIDEDNTPTFSGGNLPGSRPITSAHIAAQTPNVSRSAGERVDYPTTGVLQQTLGAAINVVVNRAGWSSGNALAVVNNSDQDPGAAVTFGRAEYRAFEFGSPAINGPKLHIVYTAPSTPLYRSVGTNGANLNTFPRTVAISGSTATFSGSIPDNVGVGDVLEYGATNLAFIHGRTSATEFTVMDQDGAMPAPTAAGTAVGVYRAYTSLSKWEAQDENDVLDDTVEDFDTSTDLVALNATMNVACYDDAPMDDMVDVTGWITGPMNYIRIFTPTSASEVGASQRHTGTEGTGFRLTPTASGANYQIINLDTGYVRIEGLEIDGSGVTNALFVRGIRVRDGLVNVGDIRIDSNIIHDLHTTQDGFAPEGSMGIIDFQSADLRGPPMRVSNNIIYDITNTVNVGHIAGIHIGSRATSYVYNNTVYGIINSGAACAPDCGPAWGIYSKAFGGGTVDVIATNNYCGSVSAVNPVERCYDTQSGSGLTQSYNVSSDATASGTGSQSNQIAYASYFVDVTPGSEDLHLLDSSFNLWGSNGADLSGNADLPVSVDIDGESRAHPDIGADEHLATHLYRSVGITAAALATGVPNALTIAGSTATFAAGLADNVGVGDAIEYDSDGNTTIDAIAFIHGRMSSTVYTVRNAAGGAPAAVAGDNDWSVFRAYTRLANWESQTENANINGAVRNFDTSTDLVTPNTIMVAAAYGDGADTTAVVVDGWVTGPGNYIKIYTPRNSDEVGASQRHSGAWDTSAYRLEVGGATVLEVRDEYVRIDGLQLWLTTDSLNVEGIGITGAGPVSHYEVSNNIVRGNGVGAQDTRLGINLWSCGSGVLKAWNNLVYDFAGGSSQVSGIAPDDPDFTFYLYNNTVTDSREGFTNYAGTVVAKNNLAYMNFDNWSGSYDAASTNNLSGPGADAQIPATNARNGVAVTFVNSGGDDFHLAAGDTGAQDFGADLSADSSLAFAMDIDHAGRTTPWDIGADDAVVATSVELVSFAARADDGAAELTWETGSELNNLGFHIYRSLSEEGSYERITAALIPGLGSSPQGARYSYRDSGLANGVTYYYELEDIETTGREELHGPVAATPQAGLRLDGDDNRSPESDAVSLVTYGDPSANALRVLTRTRRQVVLELVTEGFYAEPLDDGTVRLRVPGFESLMASDGPDTPIKRTWVEAVSGRRVELMSARAREVEVFASLHLASVDIPDIVATPEGSIRAAQRRGRKAFSRAGAGLSPSSAARIVSVGFQDDVKKALVELAPLRWDATRGELLLARRLVVRLAFRGSEPSEVAPGRGYTKRPSHDERRVLAHLATTQPGLHAVHFEDVMRVRRGVRAKTLRLSRQGETVAYHLAPNPNRFAPGSVLYFMSDGAAVNPYGDEAVYELELGVAGEPMAVVSGAPHDSPQPIYWHRQEWEQDRYYQAALVDAPDLWLWDLLYAPEVKSYPLEVSGLVASAETSKLRVWLQGVSDFPAAPDHHVRIFVNGNLVDDASWDGKQPRQIHIDLAPGVLREGDNVLELDNVGDTEAAHSMVMLDRYALEYPRGAVANDGRLRGQWNLSGAATLSGLPPGSHVVETSGAAPRWLGDTELGDDGLLRFRAEAGHIYHAVSPDAVWRPAVRTPRASGLKNKRHRADYVLIAPEMFVEATRPLLELRRSQGLRVRAVSIEQIYSEFGYGEPTPEAVKDFLSYAFHQWRQPSLRYVVLVGDATYDFKDRFHTGVTNHVPPRIVKTSFLWTASDPSYAAVNGEDVLPDFAIGRLPAATVDDVETMVSKIVAYETRDRELDEAPIVLVADNPDGAGNFEADADALAAGVLASKDPTKLYLRHLGTAGAREAIVRTFDDGASLVSYIGHGGIHLWADENVFNTAAVGSLAVQSQQPLLLTMNCLNGYFHFPYFDSLAEALVKAPGKGAIAAFSPTGLSLNRPASLFHQALLEELFTENHPRLGDAVLAAQKSYAETGAFPELLSIYHLLGDPALTLR